MMTGTKRPGRNSTKSGFSSYTGRSPPGNVDGRSSPSAGPRVGHVAADDDPLSTGASVSLSSARRTTTPRCRDVVVSRRVPRPLQLDDLAEVHHPTRSDTWRTTLGRGDEEIREFEFVLEVRHEVQHLGLYRDVRPRPARRRRRATDSARANARCRCAGAGHRKTRADSAAAPWGRVRPSETVRARGR